MCGISGLACADPNRRPGADRLEAMSRIQAHRGPDGHGLYLGPGIGLDFRRLAIIDPAGGSQPLYNENRSVVLTLNGEIYNYVELRRELTGRGHVFATGSDAEVVVHLYEEMGEDCLHRLRGMFGLALWDVSRRRLLLARDRLGIKPIHYHLTPDGDLVFTSEIKAILASGLVDRALEPRALHDLFTLGFVLTPGTIFKKISQLEPGQMLFYREGRVVLRRYWDLTFPEPERRQDRGAADVWAERLHDTLRQAVALHMRSDVPVGAWLSPGLDSNSVTALMLDVQHNPVTSYTLTYAEKGTRDEGLRCSTLDRFQPRIEARRIVCSREDFHRYPHTIWHRESPVSSTLNLAQMLLAEAAAREVKVVLAGEGADEDLGGYPWYHVDKLFRPLNFLPQGVRNLLGVGFAFLPHYGWMRRMFTAPREDRERFRRMVGLDEASLPLQLLSPEFREAPSEVDPLARLHLPEGFAGWHPLQRMQYIESRFRLTDHITHGLDRASMAYSLEVRVPFLDHEVVELCAAIPVSLKMRGLTEKYVLRRAMLRHLPREIAWRRKCAFTAADRQWLAGKLPDFAARLLSPAALKNTGYFEPSRVVRMLAEHRSGRKDHSRPLAAVLGIQVWDEVFIRDFNGSVRQWAMT